MLGLRIRPRLFEACDARSSEPPAIARRRSSSGDGRLRLQHVGPGPVQGPVTRSARNVGSHGESNPPPAASSGLRARRSAREMTPRRLRPSSTEWRARRGFAQSVRGREQGVFRTRLTGSSGGLLCMPPGSTPARPRRSRDNARAASPARVRARPNPYRRTTWIRACADVPKDKGWVMKNRCGPTHG